MDVETDNVMDGNYLSGGKNEMDVEVADLWLIDYLRGTSYAFTQLGTLSKPPSPLLTSLPLPLMPYASLVLHAGSGVLSLRYAPDR